MAHFGISMAKLVVPNMSGQQPRSRAASIGTSVFPRLSAAVLNRPLQDQLPLREAGRVRRPRIFLYENELLDAFWNRSSPAERLVWGVGTQVSSEHPYFWHAKHTAIGATIYWRLRTGYQLTRDPSEADLFVIPAVPGVLGFTPSPRWWMVDERGFPRAFGFGVG